jgi:hypothetical protein
MSLNLFLNNNKNELSLEIETKKVNIRFKYEIYGNNKLFSKGVINCNNSLVPVLNFKILDNTLFFLRVNFFNNKKCKSVFKFFNINEYYREENLSISIEDINNKILFESINLSNNSDNDEQSSNNSDNDEQSSNNSDNDEQSSNNSDNDEQSSNNSGGDTPNHDNDENYNNYYNNQSSDEDDDEVTN